MPPKIILSLAALALPAVARAEPPTLHAAVGAPDNLKLSGSVRLRYEALEGQPRAALPEDDQQIALRSTLFAERYRRRALWH